MRVTGVLQADVCTEFRRNVTILWQAGEAAVRLAGIILVASMNLVYFPVL